MHVLFRRSVIVRLPSWMQSHRGLERDWNSVNKNWWIMLTIYAHSCRWYVDSL